MNRPHKLVCILLITMLNTLNILFKRIWIVVVIVFACYYLIGNYDKSSKVLGELSLYSVALAFLFVFLGKLCLALNMQHILKRYGVSISFVTGFHIYNTTEIAKYIPGSIWQFVGRFEAYRARGIGITTFRDSMLMEIIALIYGSALFGSILVLMTFPEMLLTVYKMIPKLFVIFMLFLGTVLAFLLLKVSTFKNLRLGVMKYIPRQRDFIIQCLIWLSLGLGFSSTVLPFVPDHRFTHEITMIAYFVGVYSMAFLAGFMVPFAPAGIGIRETLLVLGMTPFLTTETAVVLASLNRFITIGVDLVLGVGGIYIGSRQIRSRTI